MLPFSSCGRSSRFLRCLTQRLRRRRSRPTAKRRCPIDLAPPLADPQAGSEQPSRELATELEPQTDGSISHADDAGPGAVAEPDWYTFWNPFRSEVAAAGFVRRLESVTGLDYRIDKVRAGVYEVAFAYGNDTELETKLAHISAATGLDLTDRP